MHRRLPTVMRYRQWWFDAWTPFYDRAFVGCRHYERHPTWRYA